MKTLFDTIAACKVLPAINTNIFWMKDWTEQMCDMKNNRESIVLIGTSDFCYYLNPVESN